MGVEMKANRNKARGPRAWARLLAFFACGVVIGGLLWALIAPIVPGSIVKERLFGLEGMTWLAMKTEELQDSSWRTFDDWFWAIKPNLPEYTFDRSPRSPNPFPMLLTAPRYGRLKTFPAGLDRCVIPVLWEEGSSISQEFGDIVPVVFLDGSMRMERLAGLKRRIKAMRRGRPFDPWSGVVTYPPLWMSERGLWWPPHDAATGPGAELVGLKMAAPSHWMLEVRPDGSGCVGFGQIHNECADFPGGTFDFARLCGRIVPLATPTGSMSKDFVLTVIRQDYTQSTSTYVSDSKFAKNLFDRAMAAADMTGTHLEELSKIRPLFDTDNTLEDSS